MNVLILGATLRGIERAIRLAKEGHTVRLTTALSYPGEDAIGTFAASADGAVAERVRRLCGGMPAPDSPAQMKKGLLKTLLSAGVTVDFYTRFIAGLLKDGCMVGALLTGACGIKASACNLVIDATTLGEPSYQMAGKKLCMKRGMALSVRLTLIDRGAASPLPALPDAEFERDLADAERVHVTARRTLNREMTPTQARQFVAAEQTALLRQLAGIGFVCDTALPPVLEMTPLNAPLPSVIGWQRLGNAVESGIPLPDKMLTSPDTILLNGIQLPYSSKSGLTKAHLAALPKRTHEIIVSGGGTAGVWAAIAAARDGAKVLLLERMTHLGGTRTLGGVSGLYCGNRSALFQRMWREITDFSSDFSLGRPSSVPEMLFYQSALEQCGVDMRLGACVCFASVENRRIDAVLSVGEDGVFVDDATQYIDATGDGALCALAGCEFDLGDKQTHMTQNFSQWNRCLSGRRAYRPIDQDVMDASDEGEWSRCAQKILLEAGEYDLYEMLTPRESRRICGRKTITLRGIMCGERTTDVIYDGFSTYDPHGRGFGIEGRLGALPALGLPKFAAVPLGAMLPLSLDGVLVTGKALSADQDGINHFRMNADVMSIGFIAGRLAAQCVRSDCDAEQLSLSDLQNQLFADGALVAPVPECDTCVLTAEALCARLVTGEDDEAFTLAVLTRPDGLDRLLRRAMDNQCVSDQTLVEMCLLLYGDCLGASRLTDLLTELDKKNGEITYLDKQRSTGVVKGGVRGAADDYWQMNRLIVLLSHARYRGAIPAILSALRHTVPGGGWINDSSVYAAIRLDVNTIPNYDRALCLAQAIQDMPDACFAMELKRLMNDIAVLPAPSATIWRDYLLVRLLLAYHACGGDAAALLSELSLNLTYKMIRDTVYHMLYIKN